MTLPGMIQPSNVSQAPMSSVDAIWQRPGVFAPGASASSANPMTVDMGGTIRAPGGDSAMTFNGVKGVNMGRGGQANSQMTPDLLAGYRNPLLAALGG